MKARLCHTCGRTLSLGGWAYCSTSCEAGANAQPKPVHEARMALDVVLETALPWERAVAARIVRKANECPDAVLRFLRVAPCVEQRLLAALRAYAISLLPRKYQAAR